MTRRTLRLAMLVCALGTGVAVAQPSPGTEGETLLAAEKAFAAAAAKTDVVSALSAMFAPDVIMPGPPGTLHRGLAAVTASLRANPDNVEGRVEWTPIRLGLSADGQHGFTFGFMTLRKKDGSTMPLKYMSYWVKGASGWRVAGYKRARRPEGEVAMTPMAPVLPAALVPARNDAAHLEALRQNLSAAERAFSDEAQQVGLGAAFTKWGSDTAVNMGGPNNAGYVVGAAAIGKSVGAGAPGTDESGGMVHRRRAGGVERRPRHLVRLHPPQRQAAPRAAPPNGTPFFTIWHRPSAAAPWRYIAE